MLKTKINLKVLILLSMMILAVLVFNTNTVNATSLSSQQLQERLEILPDELTLDITEAEYEKAGAEIEKQVRAIWEENNMDMSDVIVECLEGGLYSEEFFYKGIVRLEKSSGMEKLISVTYSNTNQRDLATLETIKNMKIESPKYYELDLEKFENVNVDVALELAEKYYKNLVKDETITLKVNCSSGGRDLLSANMEIELAFFKDGKLYEIRNMGDEFIFPIINVPSTVVDENVNEYITNLIQDYLSGTTYNEKVVSIKEGNNVSETYVNIADIEGAHTIRISYDSIEEGSGEYSELVIVKKAKNSVKITTENTDTNIKLEAEAGVLPSNVVLEVAPVTEGTVYNTVKTVLTNMKQFKVYDINLLSDGVKIQPNGKVKISIPVPTEFNKSNLVVYRVEENGDKTEYSVTVSGDLASFETDHFSTYVLAEKAVAPENEKDDTPKTGTVEVIYFILPITIISALGIIAFRKRETK